MAGDRSFNQDQVLLGQHFEYAQVFHLHAATAIAAGHAHAFDYLRRIRRSADRTGRPQAVMLAVCRFAYAAKAVALYNALEAFSFRHAYCADLIAFGKYFVNANSFAEFFSKYIEIAKLDNFTFGVCARFFEMPQERIWRIFGLRYTEA